MASLSRLRLSSLINRRYFSSILSPDSKTPLTSAQKGRAALSLLKTEKDPEKILDICRAASLQPHHHIDRIAFSIAIAKLTESKSFSAIQSYLEELKTRPDLQNESYLAHAIVLYGQSGMLEQSIRTFEKMGEMGIQPSVKSLNSLLFACIVAKKHDEVNRIFLEFPKTYNIKPNLDTYNTVIKAFCESGSSNSVYSILAEMERKGVNPNATTYGTVLAGFYKEEKFVDVGNVLDMMKKNDFPQNIGIYNTRIQSLCKLKRSAEARALFEGMLSRGMKPNSNTYYHLIHGFSREGDMKEAKRLFDSMVKNDCTPDGNCYFTLVYFLCVGGDFDTALKVYKDCKSKGWFPNFSTMKLLVNGLASISKVEEAKEIIAEVKEKFTKNAHLWEEIEAGLPQ